MLSYADRAKSKPRVPSKTDTQLSASTSVASTSPISTPPSSVAAPPSLGQGEVPPVVELNPPSAIKQEINHPLPADCQDGIPSAELSTKAEQLQKPSSSNTVAPRTPTGPRPNVWEQRAQARASAGPLSITPAVVPPLPPQRRDLPSKAEPAPRQEGSFAFGGVGSGANGTIIDDNAWPEVGPSSASASRSASKLRGAAPKEKETIAGPPKRAGEKTKWVAIPTSELQLDPKPTKVAHLRSSHMSNPSTYNIGPTATRKTPPESRNSTSAPHSLRGSPAVPVSLLPTAPSQSPRSNLRHSRESSRPHSQFSSAQNSPRRRIGTLDVPTVTSETVEGALSRGRFDPQHVGSINNRGSRSTPGTNQSPIVAASTLEARVAPNEPSTHTQHVPQFPAPLPPSAQYPYQFPFTPFSQSFPYAYQYPYAPYPIHQFSSMERSDQENEAEAQALPFSHSSNFTHSSHQAGPVSVPISLLPPSQPQLPQPPQLPPVAAGARSHVISFMPAISSQAIPPVFSPPQVLSQGFHRGPPTPRRSAAVTILSSETKPPSNKLFVETVKRKLVFGTLESAANSPRPANVDVDEHTRPDGELLGSKPNGKEIAIGYAGPNGIVDLTITAALEMHSGPNTSNGIKFTFGSLDDKPSAPSSPEMVHQSPSDHGLSSPSALGLIASPIHQILPVEDNGSLSPHPSPKLNAASPHQEVGLPAAWEQMSPPRQEFSPSSGSDFEVRDYGYGFGAPYPRQNVTGQYVPQGDGARQPPYPGRDFEPIHGYPYFPNSQALFSSSGPYLYDGRQRWPEPDTGRWGRDDSLQANDGNIYNNERRRGNSVSNRRPRGPNGRATGRGFRGNRPRDHIPLSPNGNRDGQGSGQSINAIPSHVEYPYYPIPEPGAQVFYGGGPPQQPLPLPVTTPTFPLDPMRLYLLGQVEYYFSTQNLASDTHLRKQMDTQGWITISTIASFNRVRTLTGGASLDHAISLLRDVLCLSSLVDVDLEHSLVRLSGNRWKDFVLPDARDKVADVQNNLRDCEIIIDSPGNGEEYETDDDIVFVLGKDGSPLRRNWAMPGPATAEG